MRPITLLVLAMFITGCANDPPREHAPSSTISPSAPTPPPPPAPPLVIQSEPVSPPTPLPTPAPQEVFPHVRLDLANKAVEFDATVPIDCHDAETPRVYLELFVCTPDSREHESLLVTSAKPSHIHAALLMLGLQPGAPGRIDWTGDAPREVPPTGARLKLTFRTRDGAGNSTDSDPWSWVVLTSGAKPDARAGTFHFSGSRFVKTKPLTGAPGEVYDADHSGTVIGLTTFGSETIAWSKVLSPDAAIHEPEWLADAKFVPKVGTAVTVIIQAE